MYRELMLYLKLRQVERCFKLYVQIFIFCRSIPFTAACCRNSKESNSWNELGPIKITYYFVTVPYFLLCLDLLRHRYIYRSTPVA